MYIYSAQCQPMAESEGMEVESVWPRIIS